MPAIEKQTYKPSPTFSAGHRGDHAGVPRPGRGRLDRAVQGREADRRRLPRGRPELRRLRQQQGQLRLPAARPTSTTPAPCAPTTAAVRAGSAATSSDVDEFKAEQRHPHRDAQGHRLGRGQGAGAGQVHGDPGAGRGRGPDLVHDDSSSTRARPTKAAASCRRRAAATSSASRSTTRASTSAPIRGTPTRRGAAVGRRRPAAREAWRSSRTARSPHCSTRATGPRSRASAPSASRATC